MNAKVTRRQAGAALAASALLAQAPAVGPEDEVKAARERNLSIAAQLDKVDLPMDTEPAVHFKA